MNTNKTLYYGFFFLSLLLLESSIIEIDTYVCNANIFKISNNKITICILPISPLKNTTYIENDLRTQLIDTLNKYSILSYNIILPDGKILDKIINEGFYKSTVGVQVHDYPVYDYWINSNIQYVIYGEYSTKRDDKIAIDIYLYNVNTGIMDIEKRFTANLKDLKKVIITIVERIEDVLIKKYDKPDKFKLRWYFGSAHMLKLTRFTEPRENRRSRQYVEN